MKIRPVGATSHVDISGHGAFRENEESVEIRYELKCKFSTTIRVVKLPNVCNIFC